MELYISSQGRFVKKILARKSTLWALCVVFNVSRCRSSKGLKNELTDKFILGFHFLSLTQLLDYSIWLPELSHWRYLSILMSDQEVLINFPPSPFISEQRARAGTQWVSWYVQKTVDSELLITEKAEEWARANYTVGVSRWCEMENTLWIIDNSSIAYTTAEIWIFTSLTQWKTLWWNTHAKQCSLHSLIVSWLDGWMNVQVDLPLLFTLSRFFFKQFN